MFSSGSDGSVHFLARGVHHWAEILRFSPSACCRAMADVKVEAAVSAGAIGAEVEAVAVAGEHGAVFS